MAALCGRHLIVLAGVFVDHALQANGIQLIDERIPFGDIALANDEPRDLLGDLGFNVRGSGRVFAQFHGVPDDAIFAAGFVRHVEIVQVLLQP